MTPISPGTSTSILLKPGGFRTGLFFGFAVFGLYLFFILLSRNLADRVDGAVPWDRIADAELRSVARLALYCCLLFVPSGLLTVFMAAGAVYWVLHTGART